jgi:peptide/nickel transport system permease protein
LTTLGGIVFFTSFPPLLAWLVSYPFGSGRNFVIMGSTFGLREVSWRMLSKDAWLDVTLSPSVVVFRMFLTLALSALVLLIIRFLLLRLTGFRLPILLVLLLSAGGAVGTWYLLHIQAPAFDLLRVSWVAIVTFILLSFGETMLIMQSSMTEVLKDTYIVTAQAKGLPIAQVRRKHAARNALLPVLSRLVISLPYLITGVVIVESAVGWPGMGTALWNALYWQNMPVVMDMLLLVGILSLAARLVLDVIIAYLDPRIYSRQMSTSS